MLLQLHLVNTICVVMIFAGYMKLYQLQEPTISDYDCILVDEAQDLTPGDITNFYDE